MVVDGQCWLCNSQAPRRNVQRSRLQRGRLQRGRLQRGRLLRGRLHENLCAVAQHTLTIRCAQLVHVRAIGTLSKHLSVHQSSQRSRLSTSCPTIAESTMVELYAAHAHARTHAA